MNIWENADELRIISDILGSMENVLVNDNEFSDLTCKQVRHLLTELESTLKRDFKKYIDSKQSKENKK